MALEEIIFPSNLRDIRLKNGMKMTELAKRAGLSLSAMSKIEKGVRRLNQKQLLTLCNILNCKLSDVFIKESDEVANRWKSEMQRRTANNENGGLKIFGSGLRHIRVLSGKTIAKAAKDAKMTLSVYHKIEIGQREVYTDEIEPLATSYGYTPTKLFDAIAEFYKDGTLTSAISKADKKVAEVLVPDSPTAGLEQSENLYGAKLYDNARKSLIPVFGKAGSKSIVFKKSDAQMIAAPATLAGNKNIYALVPNTKRLGGVLPEKSYIFADTSKTAAVGDLVVIVGGDFSKLAPSESVTAQVAVLRADGDKYYGQLWAPDEKVAIKNIKTLHKVVLISIG